MVVDYLGPVGNRKGGGSISTSGSSKNRARASDHGPHRNLAAPRNPRRVAVHVAAVAARAVAVHAAVAAAAPAVVALSRPCPSSSAFFGNS